MSERKTRSRKLVVSKKFDYHHYLGTPSAQGGTAERGTFGPINGTQTTVSEGHPFHWIQKGSFVGDIGGEFRTTRQYIEGDGAIKNRKFTFQNLMMSGRTETLDAPFISMPVGYKLSLDSFFPPTFESSDSKLRKLGTTAIARCKPTNSLADVSVFLGELVKEGLPSIVGSSLWRDKTESALKKGAGEFLNIEFGWLPVVSEVKKFHTAVQKADAVLKQYERDAGRLVRRRYEFESTKESSTVLGAFADTYPLTGTNTHAVLQNLPLGDISRHRVVTQRQWFSGAFTYAMPTESSSRSMLAEFARRADKSFGISLTPETLWNLSPWSWAADWVTNAGDVISNLSDWQLHGLVLRYGYIMEHTVVRDTYSWWAKSGPNRSLPVSPLTYVTETKVRKQATPFGFGVTWEGLSPTQLAILAAIGIRKS